MKPYFAKLIVVEGEIKEGDSLFITTLKDYKDNTEHRAFIQEASTTLLENISNSKVMNPQKVKLFLCSRDIQVGDKVTYKSHAGNWFKGTVAVTTNSYTAMEEDRDPDSTDGFYMTYETKDVYKIIGEISPKATWVKEGHEFDDSEVAIMMDEWVPYNCIPEDTWRELGSPAITIGIKGSCGYFH